MFWAQCGGVYSLLRVFCLGFSGQSMKDPDTLAKTANKKSMSVNRERFYSLHRLWGEHHAKSSKVIVKILFVEQSSATNCMFRCSIKDSCMLKSRWLPAHDCYHSDGCDDNINEEGINNAICQIPYKSREVCASCGSARIQQLAHDLNLQACRQNAEELM